MAKKVIPVGDGRLIEMEEGELRAPPPTPPKAKEPKVQKTRKKTNKRPGGRPKKGHKNYSRPGLRGANHPVERKKREIPGYAEWMADRVTEMARLVTPKGKVGRPFGRPDGIPQKKAEALWAEARRRALIDVENIKKSGVDLDVAAEEALTNTLEVMRSPMNQEMRLRAARQVLEWTKAKPAAKTEMTVNAAEAWLASIADETNPKE